MSVCARVDKDLLKQWSSSRQLCYCKLPEPSHFWHSFVGLGVLLVFIRIRWDRGQKSSNLWRQTHKGHQPRSGWTFRGKAQEGTSDPKLIHYGAVTWATERSRSTLLTHKLKWLPKRMLSYAISLEKWREKENCQACTHAITVQFLPTIVMSSDSQHRRRLAALFIANCYLCASCCLRVLKRILVQCHNLKWGCSHSCTSTSLSLEPSVLALIISTKSTINLMAQSFNFPKIHFKISQYQ